MCRPEEIGANNDVFLFHIPRHDETNQPCFHAENQLRPEQSFQPDPRTRRRGPAASSSTTLSNQVADHYSKGPQQMAALSQERPLLMPQHRSEDQLYKHQT